MRKMSHIHTYDYETFTDDIMIFFDDFSIPEIKKDYIDFYMRNCSPAFKKAVFQRLIRYKKGEDFWVWDEEENWTKSARELVAIWKMIREVLQQSIYDEISVIEYAQERLVEAEAELKEGKINEQRYIERCNRIKYCRERDEKLMSVCSCSPAIGNIVNNDDDNELVIVCLPCDFDRDAIVVHF